MDERERRLAQNEALFREVNEGAADVQTHWAEAASMGIICECGRETCVATIQVGPGAYEAVRGHPARFIVLDGHEFPDVEEVVERSPGYLVVEKIGDSRAYVEHLDPRSR